MDRFSGRDLWVYTHMKRGREREPGISSKKAVDIIQVWSRRVENLEDF